MYVLNMSKLTARPSDPDYAEMLVSDALDNDGQDKVGVKVHEYNEEHMMEQIENLEGKAADIVLFLEDNLKVPTLCRSYAGTTLNQVMLGVLQDMTASGGAFASEEAVSQALHKCLMTHVGDTIPKNGTTLRS